MRYYFCYEAHLELSELFYLDRIPILEVYYVILPLYLLNSILKVSVNTGNQICFIFVQSILPSVFLPYNKIIYTSLPAYQFSI